MFFGFSSIDQLLADLRQPLNWTAVLIPYLWENQYELRLKMDTSNLGKSVARLEMLARRRPREKGPIIWRRAIDVVSERLV
jgi:hypothetical protein